MTFLKESGAQSSTHPYANEPADDPRLIQATREYLQQLEAGKAPRRVDFLHRYPEIAEPLAHCLDGLEMIHQAVGRPSPIAPLSLPETILPATPLGDFQILREIGRGGMGVVYEAVQLSLGRQVALKVLSLAATFDAKHLQRFRNEAQAAASLHHTNIVPVYAVGCERGVHFYAMQFIDGQSLAELLDEIRRSQPKMKGRNPVDKHTITEVIQKSAASHVECQDTLSAFSRALSTARSENINQFYQAIARLIVQAAEGLEHAHQFGIIHRDVKPANLLIDVHGRLWITDFGLAQFHTGEGLTRTGDVLGTLRYMSPEQASGREPLDHRTDVYSLGATLYQLTTLEPMFSGQHQQELLRQILHDEPASPCSVEKSVPFELETIILKAISKNPNDRYGSVKEFGEDIQRYLDDKPIHAKRPGFLERVRKWFRRHPSVINVVLLLLFFGVIGFGASTLMVARAYNREKERAEEAEQRFKLARRSADEMIQIAQEALADHPMMFDVRRRLLEAALVYYQEFIEQRREDPGAQAELAETRDLVRKILNDLMLLQGARRHCLLKESAVREDLALSVEQCAQVSALFERMDQHRNDVVDKLSQASPEDRRKAFLDNVRSCEDAIIAILKPTQFDRLRQIAWQCHGPKAFNDPFIESELKLTAVQKQQIRLAEAKLFFDRPPPSPLDPSMMPTGKSLDGIRKIAVTQILALLTESQTKRWNELIGRPFASADQIFLPLPPGGFFLPPPGRAGDSK